MKKRIFLVLIILIAFLSVGVISASEISVNDTYTSQDNSGELLAVENVGMGSDSSNNLSINNVDTILDENTIGIDNNETGVEIDAPDITLYYKNGTRFMATLSDENGNKLANQDLIFSVSGVNYTRTTNESGQASLAINLNPGEYEIGVFYNGKGTYLANSTTATCTVLPTINGEDITKFYRNGTQYYATFLDGQGNPLANTDVNFNINGVFYTRKTNDDGTARLNINLIPNTYILTAIHPDTGYTYSNNITVLPTIISEDLVKVYRDGNQYYATFLDGQGNPLANTNVTFNIHGVFYTRTTNSSGVGRLNINLDAGEYVLTAYNPNDNYTYSSLIKVLGSSSTAILTEDYTYYEDDIQTITAQLFNELGYAVPNQEIIIYAGSTATPVKTDEDGVVSIDVELVAGNYTVQYTYAGEGPYKASKATSTLTVLEGHPIYFEIGNTTIYYNQKEKFEVTVYDAENKTGIPNQPVYFTINGMTYERITDQYGTARLTINLNPGIYDIYYEFDAPYYQPDWDTTQITVIDGNQSIFDASDITVSYGLGETFPVFLGVGDVPLVNRDVIFNINGVNYTRTTDEHGFAELTINLGVGKYLIKYYYNGEDRIEPTSGQSYVTVKEKIVTSLQWSSSTSFIGESSINLMVTLVDKDNKPLANREIIFDIGTRTYMASTNKDGIALVEVSLVPGTYLVGYEFEGDDDYLGSEGITQIVVSDSYYSHGYGYWSFGADMYNIDLAKFATLGTTDIFLNFYAFTLYGESAVVSWIENANSHGIHVHIWMQVFYSGGSWVNPISGGSINQAYFNTVIEEAKYYAGLKGVSGIHFDYLRYPGTAYKTSGGTAAVTEFARQASEACRAINPNIVMSAAVMPETTNNIYYYGQDIPALSKILDVIIPMQYKGNYNTGTKWLASTTEWFVKNSQGAEIWSGLQSYISDDNPTKLTYTELFTDAQTVVDNGADGVILFRFGLSQFLNFNDLDTPSHGDEITINDVLLGSMEVKNYIEGEYDLPSKMPVGTSYYTVPQILYLMSQATLMLNGDIPEGTIDAIRVTAPDNSTGDEIYNTLSLSQYVSIAKDISAYCLSNNQAPYAMSTSLGDVSYRELVYMYSRILNFCVENGKLPAEAYVGVFMEKPNLTVNMMPSSTHADEYQYINYTTTWLNYCPQCEHYGVLLVNPKHTYEGELTCAYCDCDYCGVTGYEKIAGSDYVLTRLSDSVPITPGGDGDVISIGSIRQGASYLAEYFEENKNFPEYVVVSEGKYTVPQFLYLMSKAIVQINSGNFTPITLIQMADPSNSGDVIDGYLTKDQYLDVFSRVYKFIENNGVVPAYASSTLGNIAYQELVDASARILDYYNQNVQLPSSVHIVYNGQSSKTISELAKSLIVGQTTDRGKATALYNYVRDEIAYEFYYDTQKGAEGTLIDGSGNCCDQAQLLVAMARAVDMTARFATGYCHFSSGSWYGHVWVQFLIDGSWINADPTSTRNSFGVINNWDTSSYTDRGTYDILPY